MDFDRIREWGKQQLSRLGDQNEQDKPKPASAHEEQAGSADEKKSQDDRGKKMAYDLEAAKSVFRVGQELRANDKVMLSAFETGIVESGMQNLNHGDQDSLGVFQQRPSQGWGTPQQILDVPYAARQYFERAIKADQQNPNQTTGRLAQSVQRSAYPERYDQAEAEARKLLDETAAAVGGRPAPGQPAPPPPGQGARFGTWGTNVQIRTEPKLDAPVLHTLSTPTQVTVDFQQRGDLVDVEGFNSPWWAHVVEFNGFMTNVFIDHPDSLLPDVPQR